MRQIENAHAEQYFSRTTVCLCVKLVISFAQRLQKRSERTKKESICYVKVFAQHYKGSDCYVKVMDYYFLYSHVVPPPPLPAGPAFGGEGRIRSLLTQARATGMNLTSLLLVNLELA